MNRGPIPRASPAGWTSRTPMSKRRPGSGVLFARYADSRSAGRRFHTEPVLTTNGVLNAAAQRIRARRLPGMRPAEIRPQSLPAKERYGATHAILLSRIGCEIDPVSRRVRPKRT
jgi:hypothetical protein